MPLGSAAFALMCSLEFSEPERAIVATVFGVILLSLTATDLERHLLPDRIVLPSILLAFGLGWILPDGSLLDSAIGSGVALAVALALVLGSLPFGSQAFGMGDAKFIVLLGALLGVTGLIVALVLGMIASGLVAAIVVVSGLRDRRDYLPIGPFLALSGMTSMLWGAELWDWWAG